MGFESMNRSLGEPNGLGDSLPPFVKGRLLARAVVGAGFVILAFNRYRPVGDTESLGLVLYVILAITLLHAAQRRVFGSERHLRAVEAADWVVVGSLFPWFMHDPFFLLFIGGLWAAGTWDSGFVHAMKMAALCSLGWLGSASLWGFESRGSLDLVSRSVLAFVAIGMVGQMSVALGRYGRVLRASGLRDSLTGLGNRRFVRMMLRREGDLLVRADPVADPFGLAFLLIGLDALDSVVTQRGIGTRDRILVGFSRRLLMTVRSSDLAARWDEEEFLVILRRTSLENTELFIERVLNNLRENPFPVGGDEVLSMTCSVGSCWYPLNAGASGASTFEEALSLARQALLEAGVAGDRWVAADP